jgi:hypothetical protein
MVRSPFGAWMAAGLLLLLAYSFLADIIWLWGDVD